MPEQVIQRSFAGGELAPALHARADQVRYVTGARTIKNAFVRKEGGVSNRAGLRYVATVKDSEEAILLRYEHPTPGSSVLIEMGDGYFRFYQNGAAVELEIADLDAYAGATPYVAGDIVEDGGDAFVCIADSTGDLTSDTDFWYPLPESTEAGFVILEIPHHFEDHKPNWYQSGEVITLTHGDVAPAELVYGGLTTWALRLVTTGPWADPVAGGAGTEGAPGARTYRYVITAAKADTYEETNASTPIAILTCAEPTPDAPNDLTWTPTTGAAEYYVYCDPFDNGVYGYIGTAAGAAYKDPGQVPDFAETPPIAVDLFGSSANYPDVATTFEQRRIFARTPTAADEILGSRVGFPSNFDISSPLQDDDALRFRLAGLRNHPIAWMIPFTKLLIGTTGGVWRLGGAGDGPLVPGGIIANQDIYSGAHDRRPVVKGNRVVYLQARGKNVLETVFSEGAGGLEVKDLTIFAAHLFEPSTFARIDYAETPHSIVWAVRNDGVLLGMTYIPEQEMVGWHQHDTTNGLFEDVCVVPEAGEDIAYFIVKRTIEGEIVRYIERMESRVIGRETGDIDVDAFFVDSGLSYSGSGANVFTGLEHLNGQVVAVVGDGTVLFDGDPEDGSADTFTVAGGQLTLPGTDEYEEVHIGLPIRFADLETLDLDVQGSDVRGKAKRVQSVTLLVDRSSPGFLVGPDEDHLQEATIEVNEIEDGQFTGQVEVNTLADWNPYGRVLIRQTNPLPLTILGIIPNLEVGN